MIVADQRLIDAVDIFSPTVSLHHDFEVGGLTA